jgi:perosamine synthetase
VAARYGELLRGIDGVEALCADDGDHERSWFVYVVELDRGIDRDAVIEELGRRGVQSRPYLPCIHLQGYMRERYGFAEGLCPAAEDASRRTLALPFFARLEAADQEYVVDALRDVLARG